MSEDRVIGTAEGMPWNVPEEYQQYLRFIRGNVVVMGRRTYEIFGEDLPSETTAIVISQSVTFDNVEMVENLDQALLKANSYDRPVFVAGGGRVYAEALPLADEMYLSTIKGEFQGDTYFPKFNLNDWDVVEERDEPAFVFRKYRRKNLND